LSSCGAVVCALFIPHQSLSVALRLLSKRHEGEHLWNWNYRLNLSCVVEEAAHCRGPAPWAGQQSYKSDDKAVEAMRQPMDTLPIRGTS
jgi:hypothetical protein